MLTFVLPWLVVADTKLGLREVEFLASELQLGSLLQLDLARVSQRRAGMWLGQYKDGEQLDRGSLVTAVCALHRLIHRRGGPFASPAAGADSNCVVVCHEGCSTSLVADVLAGYLWWFVGLHLHDAMQAASLVAGAPVSEQALLEASRTLVDSADERPSVITLRWGYNGRDIRVAGEAVGGWGRCLPMRHYPRHKCWKMQIWGLPPGQYHYKFIMDGTWVVDLGAPTEEDDSGNINNVVHQPPEACTDCELDPDPTASAASRSGGDVAVAVERQAAQAAAGASPADAVQQQQRAPRTAHELLHTVRLEALRTAFDMKMRLR